MDNDIMYRGIVYPWHCDHAGHMNIMWYVGKFDEANWSFLGQLGMTPTYVRESAYVLAAVQQNISYKRELLAGDTLFIRTRLIEIRERSIRFEHQMYNSETLEAAATCEMTAVHLDRRQRRTAPWPSEFRATALEQLSSRR